MPSPGSTCSFEYIRQPPSTTLDGCNPYQRDNNAVSISLECTIRRAVVTDEFKVRWFRENTAETVEDLGLGDPDQNLSSTDWFSRYHSTALFNQPYSPSLLGKYWCQVIRNTTADPDQPLMRSNVFTLLAPGSYNGPTCTKQIQIVDNRTCADLPDQPVVALTTTTIPVLVPSSTTMTQMSTSFFEPSTTIQPTPNTASLTSEQTTSVTTILPNCTNQLQIVDNQTCADLPKSRLPGQTTPLVFQPVQTITTLLLTSTTTSVVQKLTMKSFENTLIFSTTDQTNVYHTTFTDAVNHMNTTTLPSPSGSVTVVQLSITPIIAAASAGVVLVLIICSTLTLVVLLIVMKRKKMMKHEKKQTHTGKNTYSIFYM